MSTQVDIAKAIQLHQNGELDLAISAYQALLIDRPKDDDLLHLIAIAYGQNQQNSLALSHINQAIDCNQNESTYYNSRGNLNKQNKNLEKAIDDYTLAIQYKPNNDIAYNNLATIYFLQGELDYAEKYFKKALIINPNYTDANFNLACLYAKKSTWQLAVDCLNQTIESDPSHPKAYGQLGQIQQHQLNQIKQAISNYNKHLEIDIDDGQIHFQLGTALSEQQQYDDAIYHFQQTLLQQPDHLNAQENIGICYLRVQKPLQALPHYLFLLQHSQTVENYLNIGIIYLHLERHKEAIDYLNQADKLLPSDSNIIEHLALCYLKKGDLDQAKHYYHQAASLSQENQSLQYISAALSQSKQLKQAPLIYIEQLYNEYAPYYQQQLLKQLDYQVPKRFFQALNETLNLDNPQLNIVDLGCGTGLVGEQIKPMARNLIGVDIADNMLAIAKQSGIYNQLIKQDIQQALPNLTDLDLITAACTFDYIGDLEPILTTAHQSLNSGGIICFSSEKCYDQDYQLQVNMRYSHSKNYMTKLLTKIGFTIIRIDNLIIRHEFKQPIEGYLIVAKKP